MNNTSHIQHLFKNDNKVLASHNVSFQMNILNGDLVMSNALASLLGEDKLKTNYNIFMDRIPKIEFAVIHGIHQILLVFFNTHEEVKYKCRFNIVHSILSKNGNPIRLLRELYFLPAEASNHLPICYNNCVNITNVHFTKGVHFDIQLPNHMKSKRAKMMEYFKPVLERNDRPFSERELEILKTWKDMAVIDKAAENLGISVRTLETHLRNMRRKLQVKRSMDVVLHAKDHGWI